MVTFVNNQKTMSAKLVVHNLSTRSLIFSLLFSLSISVYYFHYLFQPIIQLIINLQDYFKTLQIERMSRLRDKKRANKNSNIKETTFDNHTRQLGSTTHMYKFYKEFLYVYY